MSADVFLRPGRVPLSDWRALYRGASIALDPIARADVEAGALALQEIVAGAADRPGAAASCAAATSRDPDVAPAEQGEDRILAAATAQGGALPAAVARL